METGFIMHHDARVSLDAKIALHLLEHLLHIIVDLLGARLCGGLGPLRALLCALRLPLRLRSGSVRGLLSAGSRLSPLSVSLLKGAPSLTEGVYPNPYDTGVEMAQPWNRLARVHLGECMRLLEEGSTQLHGLTRRLRLLPAALFRVHVSVHTFGLTAC